MKYVKCGDVYYAKNMKAGMTSFLEAISRKYYSDGHKSILSKYRKSVRVQWEKFIPSVDTVEPCSSVVLVVRDPVDRFQSACVQSGVSPEEAMNRLESGDLSDEHFFPTVRLLTSGTRLFKFEDHLKEAASFLGLEELTHSNKSSKTKPRLNHDILCRVLRFYAEDAALHRGIEDAGIVYSPRGFTHRMQDSCKNPAELELTEHRKIDISTVKGCVVFSLYGQDAKYSWGLYENIKLIRQHYHNWDCRVYMEHGHYARDKFRAMGVEVIIKNPIQGSGGMFWRLEAMDDTKYSHVVIRDADSRVGDREIGCVLEWILSGKSLHIMRDCESHKRQHIIGGAWGIMPGRFSVLSALEGWEHTYYYGDDEKFLGERVWPYFRDNNDFIAHSYDGGLEFERVVPEHKGDPSKFICYTEHQARPTLDGTWKAVMLSPEHNKDRRENFFEKVDGGDSILKGKVEWFKGCNLSDHIIPDHFQANKDRPHYYLATLDHRRIIEQAYLEGLDYLFVLEDDVYLTQDFNQFLCRVLLALPAHWKGVFLGSAPWTENKRYPIYEDGKKEYQEAIFRAQGILGVHGYLLNREGMLRVFNHLDHEHKIIVDHAFAQLQKLEADYFTPADWIVRVEDRFVQEGGLKE